MSSESHLMLQQNRSMKRTARNKNRKWDSSSLRRYEYKRLPTLNHIRILTLFPGETDAAITCHLAAVPFDKTENIYEALSYCWGDPINSVNIICNARRLAVTVNLRDALQALRDPLRPKLLWADAICINQTDNVEKGHQVRKMGEIYENAKAVRVWLGQDNEEIAEDCFTLIEETTEYLTDQLEVFGHYDDVPRFTRPFPICDDRDRWAKVSILTGLAWFSRVWVIQEVSLAKSCDLRWGNHVLDIAELLELCCWDQFRTDVKAITGEWSSGMLLSLFDDFYATYGNPKSWRDSKTLLRHQFERGFANMRNASFAGLLRNSGRVNAFDPHDHVYAFLGHPIARTELGELLIEPDYEQSLRDLYINAAFKLLQTLREAPFVLTSVLHATLADVEGHVFPSWVPQWNSNMPSVAHHLATGYSWYAAGGPSPAQAKMDHHGVISIYGIIFDSIIWTSPPIRKENLSFNTDEWEDLYLTGGISYIDNLWRTVLSKWKGPDDKLEHIFSVTLVREYPGNKRGIGPQHRDRFLAYCHSLCKAINPSHHDPYTKEEHSGYADKYRQCVETGYNRNMALTKSGRIGIVPFYAQPGDDCCIIPGMAVPFVLRRKGNGRYNLVGDSYFYGAMKGEIMEAVERGDFVPKVVVLE